MITVPITGTTDDEVARQVAYARDWADAIELRIDLIGWKRARSLIAPREMPTIATCRPRAERGGFDGPEAERLEMLREAAGLGVAYLDIELGAAGALGALPGTCRRIVSFHDWEGTPTDLDAILADLAGAGADVAKVVTTARGEADAVEILELLDRATIPTIALAMGEKGLPSRILSLSRGGHLTFASAGEGAGSAPGQVPAERMRRIYRVDRITRATAIYGVIGNPISHSRSPEIHNAAFVEAGVDAVYLPFLVDELPAFLEVWARLGVRGYSVTIPHKEETAALCDELDPLAARIGAANTIEMRDVGMVGHNTDMMAARRVIERACVRASRPVGEAHALLVGAGGAARGIAYALEGLVGRLTIANRTVARAEALAADCAAEACGLDEMATLAPDIIVNGTSVGMQPDVEATPFPAEGLRAGMVVFDAVYTPPETRLLREAAARGCLTASGVEMFLDQAACQFEIWTGRATGRMVAFSALAD